jgi:AcrR family transcriptional regulator
VLAHRRGINALTVGEVVAQAKTSRGTFYEFFSDRDSCLRFACQEAHERIFDPVEATLETPQPWLERLGETIGVLLERVVEEPLWAELCLVHSFAVDGGGEGSFQEAGTESIAAAIRGGRKAGREIEGSRYVEPPSIIEDLLAAGILSVLAQRIRDGEVASLPSLQGELVRLAACPFVRPQNLKQEQWKGRHE